MQNFNYTIPTELVKHVTALCGRPGEDWLAQLPATLNRLEQIWNLSIHEAFPAIEFNYVAPAVREDGDAVVVKIAPPYLSTEIFCEAKFLKTRNGKGCIRLLGVEAASHAIMIERAVPGENLSGHFADREPESVAPAIAVLREILIPPPTDMIDVISLDDWFDGMTRHPGTDFPASYARKALEIYETLSKQPGRTFYLHGDFHPGNVVTATREPFMAIDPKGIVGHIGYEVAVFLNNLHWWQDERPDVKQRLERSIEEFSSAFEIDPFELRQWAFAQLVLGAWWTYDESPTLYDDQVAKADIWGV
ncbi:MAG: aminoglycoside phosphotransferase family protein [Pyrinomonadaceae bacterium]